MTRRDLAPDLAPTSPPGDRETTSPLAPYPVGGRGRRPPRPEPRPENLPGLTAAELARRLPPSPLTADQLLGDLKVQGLAQVDANGCWTLTAAGWRIGRALLDMEPA